MKPEEMVPYVAFMKKHGLAELSFEHDGLKLRLVRAGAAAAPAAPAAETPAPGPAGDAAPAAGCRVVTSPLVGTFYRAPEPGAPPFVEPGAQVSVGDVLCIVEAMKVLNQVKSDCAGTVAAVKAENGQPVEYGQALFEIRPGPAAKT